MEQICKQCGLSKPLTIDYFSQGTNKRNGVTTSYWYKKCKLCDRDRVLKKSYRYKSNNRSKIAAKQRDYHKQNKRSDSDTKKIWYQQNKDLVKKRVKKNLYKRRKTDAMFKLKESISRRISDAINKNHNSIRKFLPYSMRELKAYLESLFEPWMTWDNYGIYRVDTWDDNDSSTWTWQVDHIIPHSKFRYTSMEDREFKDCWALKNLRPYSAKQNVIDGKRYEDKDKA